MSLQDKKLQLLSQDEVDNDAEVDDIFSRYGGDEAEDSSVKENVIPAKDGFSAVADVDPIEDVVSLMNEGVAVEVPDPKDHDEKKWEKELEQKNTVETAPVVELKEIDEEVVSQNESSSDVKESPKESVVPQEDVVEHAVVAPPVKQNHNAVMQGSSVKKEKASYQKRQSAPKKEIHIDPSKKTILIVDDDIDTLDMYADVFENAEYNVIRATDGLDALNVISDHTPHLIFTGIVMPRMDGFAMMESLKQNKRTADIPVVINSHLGRESDRKRADELGARDFIVRGFTPPREALERIGALLMRNEYVFRFDHNHPEARKLAKDLGAGNFFVCPRGQEMVIKMSIADPKDMTFSARFSCVDEKKK